MTFAGNFLSGLTGSGVTLGSAVTTSMNLTSNGTSEALEPAVQVSYKTESTPDMHQLYYQVSRHDNEGLEKKNRLVLTKT